MISHSSLSRALLPGAAILLCVNAQAVDYPATSQPGKAQASSKDNRFSLSNSLISFGVECSGNKLRLGALSVAGKQLPQKGSALFELATKQASATTQVANQDPFMAIELKPERIDLLLSSDGKGWQRVHSIKREGALAAQPKLMRVGKMSGEGKSGEYVSLGDMGDVRFDELSLLDGNMQALLKEDFEAKQSPKDWTLVPFKGDDAAKVFQFEGGRLAIATQANRSAYMEKAFPQKAQRLQVRVGKGSDRGDSWGPGLALEWPGGEVVLFNRRAAQDSYTVKFPENGKLAEKINTVKVDQYPAFNLSSEQFELVGKPQIIELKPQAKSSRAADAIAGKALVAKLKHAGSGLSAEWRAELRDNSGYVRQVLQINAGQPIELSGLELLNLQLQNPQQGGSVAGSPIIDMDAGVFCGVELPVTVARIDNKNARVGFGCVLPMKEGVSHEFASVIGTFPKNQMRRAFLHYLERERAMPYTQFLHYNSWYQTGLNPRQDNLVPVAKAYQKELVQKRGVKLDSFVIDDGWDNPQLGLWQPDPKKFPGGFAETTKVIRDVPSNFGIWISPLGGYFQTDKRNEWAHKMNLFPANASFDLSWPGYYNWFRDRCSELITKDGVNYFKWDKAGEGVSPHFMALLSVARDLRKVDPKLFINTTVGTWPSPFWLNHVDCTWRDGSADVGWTGKGDNRESWINYRDGWCKKLIVDRAPLYPLNSIMHHGLVLGTDFQAKKVSEAGNDLKNDARMFFASGANLQELYLSPDMMNDAAWDQVAAGAKWAQKHKQTLVDVHWAGGDPLKNEVYGYAAWSPKSATLGLRNPDDKPKSVTIEPTATFEPVSDKPLNFEMQAAYPDQRVKSIKMEAGKPTTIELQPFEVLVFETK